MSKRIYLRALETSDIDRMHRWHNDPQLYATLTSPFHPVSRQTVEDWIKERCRYSDKEINYAICLSDSHEHIGNMYLREIDYINRHGFLGAFIGDAEHRAKGYAGEALLQTVDYAFNVLGLRRLYMYVLADNAAALKHLQKCAFLIEGKMRQNIFKDGQFKDVCVLGMCLSDYESLKAKRQNDPRG